MKKLIILMALMSLFIVGIVNADTATIQAPASSGTVDGSGLDFNISFTVADTTVASVTCAVLASSPSTANSSSSEIFNLTNSTNPQGKYINYTLASADVLEDSNDYTVSAKCYNGSTDGAFDATDATSVIVDRTTPAAPTTTHSIDTEFDDVNTKTITYTVTGADTTSCRISFGKTRFTGTNTFAMTHSGNSCTYTVTKATIPDETYTTYVQASDGTNNAISSGRSFKIKTLGDTTGDEIASISVPVVKKAVSDKLTIMNIVLIVVIGGIVYMAYIKKK